MPWTLPHLKLPHPPPCMVAVVVALACLAAAMPLPAHGDDPPAITATDGEPPAGAPMATAEDTPAVSGGDDEDAPRELAAIASDEGTKDADPPLDSGSASASDDGAAGSAKTSETPLAEDESNTPDDPQPSAADAPGELPAAPRDAEPLQEKPAAAPVRPRISLDPASLDGVHPGTTTRTELHEKWGKPQRSQRIAGGARELYRLDKLGLVRATIFEDVVNSLAVHIDKPLPLDAVATRLALGEVEPVDVYDEQGELLGAAYPERGVLLGYLPNSRPPRVFQVVVESIDAQPFLARAESRLKNRYAESLADIEQALALDPRSAQAHHLHAELSLRRGKLNDALESAEEAANLEPQEPRHRLLIARVLAAAGDYSQAVARVRDVLDDPRTDDLTAARAWCQSGDYLSRSARRDFAEAIKHHQQAIRLAEPLAASKRQPERRAAKELLLDAHLAVAYDIGWGRWQQKSRVVPKWIDRAAVLADDLLRTERTGPEVRLQVYNGALAALAGVADPPEAGKWIEGTRQLGRKIYDQAQDAEYRAQLAWQLGQALSNAVEIETALQRSEEALTLGALASALLDEGQSVAGELPTYDYERGRLCYRVGLVYALDRQDHAQAIVWFDRAAPLLEQPVPAAAIDAGTQGETFVSMAVSYWEQQNREEALRLTSQGLKLMEQAVDDGVLDATALAVPYNNLSAMHEALGDVEQARWCADLAARYEKSTTK